MNGADFLVVGGGVAGLSAAARLAAHGRVAVIEAEDALGYHSSGRSVTFSHYGIGNATVRGLTQHSRDFFLAPPEGDALPLSRQASALFFATEEMLGTLDALQADMARFTDALESTDAARMKALFPPLKVGADAAVKGVLDPTGLKLDADALLQHYARAVRAQGGTIHTGKRLAGIARNGEAWTVTTEGSEAWTAPILIDAAGAWADHVAVLAGVQPLGLQPKRRTIIAVEPPAGSDTSNWPFLKTVTDDFYMMPEAGTLLASPVDEIDSDPCDAWPEEYDLAVTAAKVEHYTELSIRRIGHSWAGLRSFVADRVPTAGFAPDAPGFFWLAGQGGYGLQTAPAMAEIVETLVTGAEWPARLAQSGVTADKILPARLFAETN